MTSKFFLNLFLLLIYVNSELNLPKDKDVLILTDLTFDSAINNYEYLMVFFYAPWCIRCNKFHPEYDKAASILKNENLFLAKVDATVEKKLDKKFEITGFPVLKLFIKGKPVEYNGERNHEDLIKWIRKKTNGIAIEELNSEEDLDIFKQSSDAVLVYYGEDENDIKICTKIARKYDEIPFGIIKDKTLREKYANNVNKIILYKNFDEKKNELNIIKEKEIEKFINKYSTPKLMTLNKKAVNFIFEKKIPGIILYANEKSKKWTHYKNLMLNISQKINYKYKVIITDIKEGLAAKNAEIMSIKEKDLPTLRIADTSGDYLKKYKMDEELNEENILKFITNWENKKINSYIRSSEEPETNDGDVKIIVGKTFQKEVIDNEKDVMILFYSPLCYHLHENCKELLQNYPEVAKKLKKLNPNLIMAKIDAIENEVESIQISSFPKVKFFPGKKKNKAPIDYDGDNSIDDIIKFIKENSSNNIILDVNEEL
jgi:protein disulfide-isomerase A1